MKIEWTIKKQRGRFRAVLEYTISLEQWEKDLNPEQQVVKIVTGKEKNTGRYVDGDLSDQIGNKYYRADVTSEPGADTVTLRYYGNNHEYPEIKKAFEELSTLHEAAIRDAYDQRPINTSFLIETSPELKKYVVPGLTADKMSF
jgi:hypothetical protein